MATRKEIQRKASERELVYKQVIQLIRKGHDVRGLMVEREKELVTMKKQYLEIRKEVERLEKEYDL